MSHMVGEGEEHSLLAILHFVVTHGLLYFLHFNIFSYNLIEVQLT